MEAPIFIRGFLAVHCGHMGEKRTFDRFSRTIRSAVYCFEDVEPGELQGPRDSISNSKYGFLTLPLELAEPRSCDNSCLLFCIIEYDWIYGYSEEDHGRFWTACISNWVLTCLQVYSNVSANGREPSGSRLSWLHRLHLAKLWPQQSLIGFMGTWFE